MMSSSSVLNCTIPQVQFVQTKRDIAKQDGPRKESSCGDPAIE